MRGKLGLWALAVLLGVINALVLKGYEFAVNNGTQWLWNDELHSNVHRWEVLPIAGILGLIYAGVLWLTTKRFTEQPRIPKPKTDLSEDPSGPPPTLQIIGIGILIGWTSLIAGASLGPEAPLMAFASSFGIWIALRRKANRQNIQILTLASIGALLVAFIGSLLLTLIPLGLLWKPKDKSVQQSKHEKLLASVPIIFAAVASYATIWIFAHPERVSGWLSIPADLHFSWLDIPLALVVGFVGAFFGFGLKRFTELLHAKVTSRIDKTWPLLMSALLFGLIIGLLYFLGNSSLEFNGSAGSHLVLEHVPAYGLWTLIWLLLLKLFVTSWSMASGYRGGTVFPSIYAGVVIFLIAHNLFGVASAGILVGSLAGIFGALVGPLMGGIMIAAIVPLVLLPVAALGIVGAIAGNRVITNRSKLTDFARKGMLRTHLTGR